MSHPSRPSRAGPVWALRSQMASQYILALAYTHPNLSSIERNSRLYRKNTTRAMHFDNMELLNTCYEMDGSRDPVTALPKAFQSTQTGSPKFLFYDADYMEETTTIRLLATPRDLVAENAGIPIIGHLRLSATCGVELFTACQDPDADRQTEDEWRTTTDDQTPAYRYSPSGLLFNYVTTAKGKKANNLAIIRPPSMGMHLEKNLIKREKLRYGLIKVRVWQHFEYSLDYG